MGLGKSCQMLWKVEEPHTSVGKAWQEPSKTGRQQGLVRASAKLGESHSHLSRCLLRPSLGTTALFHLCSALWTPLAPSEPFLMPPLRLPPWGGPICCGGRKLGSSKAGGYECGKDGDVTL